MAGHQHSAGTRMAGPDFISLDDPIAGEGNRRGGARFPARLQVDLRGDAGSTLTACIDNYCDSGLLLRLADFADPPFRVGQQVAILTKAKGGKRLPPVRIRIVRLTDEGFGAMFLRPEPKFVEHLHSVAPSQKDTACLDESGGGHSPSSLIESIAGGIAKDHFQAVFSETLQSCAQEIHERLNFASTDQDYHAILRDLAAVQAADKEASRQLIALLLNRKPSGADGTDAQELALVDLPDFERWLEAAKVANGLEEEFGRQLLAIDRFGEWRDRGDRNNRLAALPYGPHHIIETLNAFAEMNDLGPVAREQLFSAARAVLSRSLGSFYERVHDRLQTETAGQLHGQSPRPDNGPAGGRDAATPDAGTAAEDPEQSAPEAAAPGPRLIPMALPMPRFGGDPEQYKRLAAQTLSTLSADTDTSETTSQWLAPLSQSLMQEVTSDPGFLQQRYNPLRELVDELEHLGRLIAERNRTENEQRVVRAVSTLISRAVADPAASPGKFAPALSQVKHLTDQLSRRYQRNVERNIANSIGRYRLKVARRRVSEELNRRYADHLVPRVLPKLLKICWHAYLTLHVLRRGRNTLGDGQPWETLDALIQALYGQPYDRRETPPGPFELLEALHEGLAQASFDPLQREQLADELKALLIEGTATPDDLQMYIPLETTAPPPAPPRDPAERAQRSAAEVVVDGLAVGDLIRWETPDAPPQQIRLVWVSDDAEDFTFVGHTGVRALDAQKSQLVDRFAVGELKQTDADQRSLSSRTVEKLLGNLEHKLKSDHNIDALTGLLNRVGFQPLLEELLKQNPEPRRHQLCWIEMDQVKLISTSLGFGAADHAIKTIAERIREAFTDPKDALAYLGSDQFAVLVSPSTPEDAYELGMRLCRLVSDQRLHWGGRQIPITVGVGIVDLADAKGKETKTRLPNLLKLASRASQSARRQGCKRPVLSGRDDAAKQPMERSLDGLMYLDRVLERGKLRLRAQKIAYAGEPGNPTHHYEVLLGVLDEKNVTVDIGMLIGVAEAHERMHLIDAWVIREALRWAGENPKSMTALGGLAINLSGQSVTDLQLVDTVEALLREHRIEPSRISFEVTETAAISRIEEAQLVLNGLRELGLSCALDDFGTGLSSFSFLKELPVDLLKIDGSFVKTIATNKSDYAVVQSMNEIAHLMGKRTIAEYVTDADVLRCVAEIGIDFAQGFAIGEPRLLDELRIDD